MMTEPHEILNNLKVSGNLPSMPQVLAQLIDLCHASEVDLQQIAGIIQKDAALSAKILQLVNSAFIGSRKAFSDIEQSVIYLGADTTKNLAISIAVQQVFRRVETNGLLSIDRFWYHSYQNALLAHKIAEAISYPVPSEVYLAGLLHDIGKLLLWMAFPGKYAPLLLKGVRCHNGRLAFLEEEKLHINHCEAGAWLCNQWQLPSIVADAIRYHHHPAEEVEQALPLTKIIYLADMLSHSEEADKDCEQIAARFFSLDAPQVHVLQQGIDDQIEQIAQDMGIRIPNNARSSMTKEPESEEVHKETTAGLINRVRDITQLNGALDNLLKAEGRNQILATVEESMKILFNEDTCLLLLWDADTKGLNAQVSENNKLIREAASFYFNPQQHDKSMPGQVVLHRQLLHSFMKKAGSPTTPNLLDRQLLHLLNTDGMLIMPLLFKEEIQGLLVIGIKKGSHQTLLGQLTPLHLLANHAAVCVYLDRIHALQAERIASERLDSASIVAKKIAHEINNPLAIIRNYIKILDIKAEDDGTMKEELSIIDSELERIGQITEQLKNLAQDDISIFLEKLDLNQHLEKTIRLYRMSMPKDKKIALHFDPEPDLPLVRTDANCVRQMVINLLSNAIDAVADNDRIIVRTAKQPNEAIITIEDSGPGIPKSLLHNIFTPGTTTKDGAHAGLGLAIVKKIATELGGSISLDKNDGGTTFSIRLPAHAP